MSRRKKSSIFDLMTEYIEDFKTWAEEMIETMTAEHPSWDTRTCCLEPLCNVLVTIDKVVVTADLPNTNPDSVTVKAAGEDLIAIKAEMRRKLRFDDLGITHRRGEFSSFRCQVRIPKPVETNRMQVRFKRGILEVRLPRKKGYEIKVE